MSFPPGQTVWSKSHLGAAAEAELLKGHTALLPPQPQLRAAALPVRSLCFCLRQSLGKASRAYETSWPLVRVRRRPGASLRLPRLPAASPCGEPLFPSRKPPFPSPTACLPSPSPFSLAFRSLSLLSPAFHSGQEPGRALLIAALPLAGRALTFPLAPAVRKAGPKQPEGTTRNALVKRFQRPEGKAREGRSCGGTTRSVLIPTQIGSRVELMLGGS